MTVCINILFVNIQYVVGVLVLDHVGTVIAEKHIVDNDVGADFQLYPRRGHTFFLLQRGTVTAYEDTTLDDNRLLGVFSSIQTERHLLGIGTEGIQGIDRVTAWVVVEVLILIKRSQVSVVGIGIRAVATTIDVAKNAGVDTHGITTIDLTRDIITAIDIGNLSAAHRGTSRQTDRSNTAFGRIGCHVGHHAINQFLGTHVGSAAATIDVGDKQIVIVI